MGYHDHDVDLEDEAPAAPLTVATRVLALIVRLTGLALLIAGLVVAVLVLREAWALYESPQRIEPFAAAVEVGSHIDRALAPPERSPRTGTTSPATGEAPDAAGEPVAAGLRLSYFFAWFIVFMLIIVIARIAMAAISTGGRLVLYDTEVRRFARALIEETRGKKR